MNPRCINIQHPDFKPLFETFFPDDTFTSGSLNAIRLASKIGVWQQNNETDSLPNIFELTKEDVRNILNLPIGAHDITENIAETMLLSVVPERFKNRRAAFTNDAVKTFNQFFFSNLFADRDNISLLFSDSGTAIYQDLIEQTKQDLINVYSNFTEITDVTPELAEIIQNWEYLIDNLDRLVQLHKYELQKYNIELISEETLKTEETGNSTDLWVTESLKYSSKQKASSNVRLEIGTLKSTERNVFSVPNLIDFGKVFNLLANKLSNLTISKSIKTQLSELGKVEGSATELYNKLFTTEELSLDGETVSIRDRTIDEYTLADITRILEFVQTFSKHYNNYDFAFVGSHGQFQMVDAVINTSQKRMIDRWATNQATIADNLNGANKPFLLKDGAFIYNQEFFKFHLPSSLSKAAVLNHNPIFSLNQKEKQALAESLNTTVEGLDPQQVKYNTYKKFLNILGIEYETNALPSNPDKFYNAVNSIIKTIREGKTGLLFGAGNNVKNYLNHIIEHVKEHTVDYVENQFLNFANETQYNVQLNSYLTLIEDIINESGTIEEIYQKLPHLNNVFSKDSKILEMVASGKKTLKMSFFEGLKNETTGEATQFAKLSYADKIMFNLNSALSEYHPIFRAGDNSQERLYNIQFYDTNLTAEMIEASFLNDMMSYLSTEINYFREMLKNSSTSYNNATLESIIESSMFGDIILDSGLGSTIENLIKNETDKTLTPVELAKLKNSFKQYFNERKTELKEFILTNEIIYKDGEVYKNRGLKTDSETTSFTEATLNSTLTKLMANRITWNIEQTKLFTGHPMFYANADNFFKRMSAVVGTKKKSINDSFILPLIEKHFQRKNSKRIIKENKFLARTAVFSDVIVHSELADYLSKQKMFKDFNFAEYNKMNEADAISYLSLDFYRDLRLTNGDWTNADERLYQWLNKEPNQLTLNYKNFTGETEVITKESQLVNLDGSRTVFNPLKPQYFGPLAEQGFTPAMYKTGAFPILPTADTTMFPNVGVIQRLMKKDNIDIVTFESANKVGTKLNARNKIQTLFDTVETEGSLVAEINESKDIVTQDTYMDYWGIQLDTGHSVKNHTIKGSQFMKLITSNLYNDGKISKRDKILVDRFQKIHEQLIDYGINELKEEFQLTEKDGNYNPAKVAKVIELLTNESSKRGANNNVINSIQMLQKYLDDKVGIDVLSNRDKIENILMAIADSRIFSQKINGSGFVQIPSTLFEKTKNGKGYKYVNKEFEMMSNDTVRLRPDGTMEVLLPYRYKQQFKIEDIDLAALQMIGFRIPTSGLNSIEKIEVVGFLPAEYGDAIILPSEIVAKAGSDFDIDKLQIFIPNTEAVDGKLKAIQYVEGEKNTKEQLQNELIRASWEILDLPKNRVQHLESITTRDIKQERDRIVAERGLSSTKSSFTQAIFDIVYYNEVTQRNITSKQLTGIAALHVTDHQNAIKNAYYVSEKWGFEEGSYNLKEDGVSFAHAKSVDGKYISNNLNQGLNASVDGAKDPLFFDLNITLDNSNLIFTLMRSGMSLRNIMTFINQPIIRDYNSLQSLKKSLLNKGENQFLFKNTIDEKIDKKYGKEISPDTVTFAEMEKMLSIEQNKTTNAKQRKVLELYKAVEKTTDKLNEYIQSTRIDTEAGGKNTSEFDLKLFHADRVANKKSGIINAEKLFEKDGFLNPYYEALKQIDLIYTPYFSSKVNQTKYEYFNEVYQDLLAKIALNNFIPQDVKIKILDSFKTDFLTAQVLQNEIIMNGKSYGKIADKTLQLISGRNSAAKRLKQLKESGFNSPITDALQPILGTEAITIKGEKRIVDHIKMYDQRLDPLEANILIESFSELFTNPETSDLAADLTAVTLLQSGLQNTPMTYTKLIPSHIYMEIMESVFLADSQINIAGFETSYYFNNYHINELVPTIFELSERKYHFISKKYNRIREYNRLSTEKQKEWRAMGKPFRETIPTIYINSKHPKIPESLKIFVNDRFKQTPQNNGIFEIQIPNYRDLSRNRLLTSYYDSTLVEALYYTEISNEAQVEANQIVTEANNTEESIIEQLNCNLP